MNSMGDRNMRHTVNQVAKGARELQNLVLTINYEAIPAGKYGCRALDISLMKLRSISSNVKRLT